MSISPYNLPSPLESLFCCCLCSKVRSEKFPLCELLMPYKQNRHKKCFLTLMGVFLMCEGSQSTLQRAGVLTIANKKHNSQCVFFLALKLWGLQKRIWATFSEVFFPEFFTFFETRSVNLYVRSFEFGPGGEKCKSGGEKFKSAGGKVWILRTKSELWG